MSTAYPVKDILTGIASSRDIPLNFFSADYFLPEVQREQFPLLTQLSSHLAYPYGLGVEVKRDGMTVFEAKHQGLSFAYFGRPVKQYSNYMREFALLESQGRKVYISLNENGQGQIEVEDLIVRAARSELADDSFGGSFDQHPKAQYGFKQNREGSELLGVRAFLEKLLE